MTDTDELARLRGRYWYHVKQHSLLNQCQAEVLMAERQRLKAENLARRNIAKVRRFLAEHPEYEDRFQEEGEI